MKTKHTPGPWVVERNKNLTSITAIGPLVADEYAGSAWLDVKEDDVRLIAAAPELLEALKQLVVRIEASGGIGAYQSGPAFVMRDAYAAIAKATGEQP